MNALEFMKQYNCERELNKLNVESFDFASVGTNGENILIFSLKKNINFSEKQWDYIIEHSDLSHTDNFAINALIAFLEGALEAVNVSAEKINYLLRYSDLKHIDKMNVNALVVAFLYYDTNVLSLEQLNYLIDNSQLNLEKHESSMISYALMAKNQGLKLSADRWDRLIEENMREEKDIIKILYFFKRTGNERYISSFWQELTNKNEFINKIEKINEKNANRYCKILNHEVIVAYKEKMILSTIEDNNKTHKTNKI